MGRPEGIQGGEAARQFVQSLVTAAAADTVYSDLYLRRARELFATVLSAAEYEGLKRVDSDIDEAIAQSRKATMLQDWQQVERLASRVEDLRSHSRDKGEFRELGAAVYDNSLVGIDPFSPGFESVAGCNKDPAAVRDDLVEQLAILARGDAPLASFYESRRAFFAALTLYSTKAAATPSATRSIEELEQLAAQAAQRGDMTQLRFHAQEVLARKASEGAAAERKTDTPTAIVSRETYRCPVDLSTPFSDDVITRARALGFASARTAPLPQAAPLLDYVIDRIWQPDLSGTQTEVEGTMRAEAVVTEAGFPPEVAEPIKLLVGQFLCNPFVNSGGARYLPNFSAEAMLIEDFPEDKEAPADNGNTGLLSALGLARRRGLARVEIDDALLAHGAKWLEEALGLDPKEFRLVCIPQELYMRFGRDHDWGRQQQWTHFDGYQVLKNGRRRALVGGDVRYGGLTDLVSIGMTDRREGVLVRFAVIRRARQVARWR